MKGRRLLVGVTGGIAAYKTAGLVSQLVQAGGDVSVVMTHSSLEFIGQATFAALTGRPVATQLFDPQFPLGAHIQLARENELLCIAPTSAHCLARLAQGQSDDLLSTLYLCFTGPVVLAPAMNDQMWKNPAVQRNVETLRQDGVHFIDPEEGWLSCRQSGAGRMADPDEIANTITHLLSK
ncbi:MAG: phosphopantothenoylcysteine decarboxylase [Planctomycetaceae bacterium]|nr:phosphopantothenoylcysteine decarboxylase [Planctomycetaceae bacterium]